MKTLLILKLGIFVIGTLALTSTSTLAQTTANGPYYATPSWDQTLPSNTRFIVLSNFNNEAVLDRETGLVWEKSPLGPPTLFPEVTYGNAHFHCNELNKGGRYGWRVPLLQELLSLLDPSVNVSPKLPSGHPFTAQGAWYWSGTSALTSPGFVWVVDFRANPLLSTAQPTGPNSNVVLVWCVRSGGPGADIQ